MGMNAPTPGLKRLRHNANSPKRVELIVPAGDELEVSDEVAAQLQAADPHFEQVTSDHGKPRRTSKTRES